MKRGNTDRRAQRARSNVKPDRRRTITGLPIAIVCTLLAGAGTAALWAVESGVVTSASSDPARIEVKTTSPATDRPAVVNIRDGHGHDHQDHDVQEVAPRVRPATRVPVTAAPTASTEVDIEFWVEWGGGEARSWFGTFRLDQGEITTARGYGRQADAPGSMVLENNVVTISPRLPRSFDSVLIRATAARDANLLVDFVPNGSPSDAFEAKIPLLDVLNSTQHRALDDRDNKLIIRRTASDSLRLQTDRASMVFEPQEMFEFSVLPNEFDSTERQRRCRVQLQPARSESNLWVDERDAVRNSDGSMSEAGPFKVTMPREEGVYDLIISFDKRLASADSPAQSGQWRKVQVVVVQSEEHNRQLLEGRPREAPKEYFQIVQEFDPANPKQPLAVSKRGTFFGSGETVRGATSHGDVVPVVRFKQDLLKIGADSWFALPLRVTELGRPHILEIDYPNDAPQTLGVAIYEPGSPTAVVDTGLRTSVDNLSEKPGVATYRLTFWPRSTAPILVLANRDAEQVATIGAVRVVAGPERLRELGTDLPAEGRLLAAHLNTPLFPELFSATLDVDRKSGRKLRDWVTFFDGAKRLIQVLKRRGYNGAVIPVLSDGGSLYPSSQLEPTPLFDDGVFFATAQDPMQKDVLEMLLRMFDREGLRLVPAVRFTGTLPILEAKRRLGGRPSINLVNTDGKRWRPRPDSFGAGCHYNPLDQDVQAAMFAAVSELSQRCSSHASFAGVAIQLDPESYAILPGPDWGADDATLKRFVASQTESPASPPSERQMRQEWLAWRADRLAEMYQKMSRGLRDDVPGSRLYLLGSSLLDTPLVKNSAKVSLAPTGLTAASAMLSFGIDAQRIREQGIVFLSPRQMKPALPDHVDLDRAWDRECAKLFGQLANSASGSLLQYPLEAFDATTIAGKLPIKDVAESTKTIIAESGALSRRGLAHGLATLDSQTIFDGAWQTPRDEQVWRDTVLAYRQLPEVQFTTVLPPAGSRTQPVVIRRAVHKGKTLFYVVNDSPRSADVQLGIDGPSRLELKSLSATTLPRLKQTELGATLSLALRPFEVLGIEASQPDARVVRWETKVDPRVLTLLQMKLQRLDQCVAAKREYPLLVNPDFDQPATRDTIPGWEFGKGAGMQVQVDTQAPRHGRQALHLRSETPVNWSSGPIVWLRSEWFAPAPSGRLVFGGWLKIRDFEHQPHVRLLVEGRLPNNQLVRSERVLGAVRSDPTATPLGADWNYYAVFLEGLPANVKQVRVGIDLRGTGDVWVDHVGVYDLWLNEQEQAGLNRDIGIASSMLEDGHVVDCEQLLKSHYAQYLFANFPAPAATKFSEPAAALTGRAAPEPPSELPRQAPSFQVSAWPDFDAKPIETDLNPGGLQVAEMPRPPGRLDNEPRQWAPSDVPAAEHGKTADARATPDHATLDRTTSDRATSDRATSDRTTSDRATSDRATSDRATTDRATTDRATTDRATTDRATTDRATPVADRQGTARTTTTPVETEPTSWIDKLKSIKIKLPEMQKRPPRENRPMFDWMKRVE